MYPVEPIGGGAAPSQIDGASSRQRCGNDGQRKRVAHMPTATTTKEDSRSKLVQNHPHDFTKKQKTYWTRSGAAILGMENPRHFCSFNFLTLRARTHLSVNKDAPISGAVQTVG